MHCRLTHETLLLGATGLLSLHKAAVVIRGEESAHFGFGLRGHGARVWEKEGDQLRGRRKREKKKQRRNREIKMNQNQAEIRTAESIGGGVDYFGVRVSH